MALLDIIHIGRKVEATEAVSDPLSALLVEVPNSLILQTPDCFSRKTQTSSQTKQPMSSTVEAAKAEYTKIKDTNFSEIERYEKQRESDFVTMLHNLSSIRSSYAENCAKASPTPPVL